MKGGRRPGAGRPVGTVNKRTREMAEKIQAEGITPLEYMLKLLRDDGLPQDIRLDAANKAAPYVHARLAAIDVKADIAAAHHIISDKEMVTSDWAAAHGVEE